MSNRKGIGIIVGNLCFNGYGLSFWHIIFGATSTLQETKSKNQKKNTAKGIQLDFDAQKTEPTTAKPTPIVRKTTKAAEMILMHIGHLPVWDHTILFAHR